MAVFLFAQEGAITISIPHVTKASTFVQKNYNAISTVRPTEQKQSVCLFLCFCSEVRPHRAFIFKQPVLSETPLLIRRMFRNYKNQVSTSNTSNTGIVVLRYCSVMCRDN